MSPQGTNPDFSPYESRDSTTLVTKRVTPEQIVYKVLSGMSWKLCIFLHAFIFTFTQLNFHEGGTSCITRALPTDQSAWFEKGESVIFVVRFRFPSPAGAPHKSRYSIGVNNSLMNTTQDIHFYCSSCELCVIWKLEKKSILLIYSLKAQAFTFILHVYIDLSALKRKIIHQKVIFVTTYITHLHDFFFFRYVVISWWCRDMT